MPKRQQATDLRNILNDIPDGILILDKMGKCIDVNPAAVKLLGITKNKLIGKEISSILIADHKANRLVLWKNILKEKSKELVIPHHKNGKWVQIGIRTRQTSPAPNYVMVLQDITIRKKTEKSIQKQAQMLDFANDTIMIRDLKDRITYWNQGAERLYGWSRKETLGKHVHSFLKTEFPEPLKNVLGYCKRNGHWEGVLIHTKRNGTKILVSSRWTLERDEKGKPIAFLEINHDITERKQAEDELQKANDELEERVVERTRELSVANERLKALSARLISAQEEERWRISRDLHDDLGQILTSMNLNLQRAIQIQDRDKGKDLIRRVISANQEARNRLRELSSLLRPRVLDDVGLKEAIQTYISEFESRTGVKSVFVFDCKNEDFPDIATTNIYRILQEGLTNISKHAHANKVKVELSVKNATAVLKILDNGTGFNPALIRVDKTLGLLGMRERSELLGGSFHLSSSQGSGTQISVIFPISGEEMKDRR